MGKKTVDIEVMFVFDAEMIKDAWPLRFEADFGEYSDAKIGELWLNDIKDVYRNDMDIIGGIHLVRVSEGEFFDDVGE